MKDLPPEILANAVDGNRDGMADAYGIAAAWLRNGEAPPKEMCEWLAARLEALALAIADRSDVKKAGIVRAVGAVDAGKKGRKAASPTDQAMDRLIVWEVYYQQRQGLRGEACFDRVAKLFAQGGKFVSAPTVAQAWKNRTKLIPELDTVTLD